MTHQTLPEIDYNALIKAAYADPAVMAAQGTPKCVAFAKGAEWFRAQCIVTPETAEPVVWVRDQRGEFEGRETLDSLFLLGASRPQSMYGATYSPLYAAPVPTSPSTEGTEQREVWPEKATPAMIRAWRSKAVNASFSDAAYQAMREVAQATAQSKPAVPAGMVLVKSEKLRHARTQAKLAADLIVNFSKAKPGGMCGYLDDACLAAGIAANDLDSMLLTPSPYWP